ncbi:uncharacterized protein LOC121769428 [Salvia splendens]|uniref:uncharacterized protein LOC121769428 n=1 Tax=Salvia splendens TaxID=180675 RepID=UPI001C270710|nr:uncharacterized protein LOC121769428 [Salvia splendens]
MNGVNASQQQQIVWLAVKIPAVESGGAGAFRGAVLGNVAGFNGATLASGMTNYIFVAYSNALAALILLHLSLLVHSYLSLSQMLSSFIQGWVKKGLFCRSSNRPPLTFDFLLLGSINIVVGFYSVMWGKAKEVKVIEKSNNRLLCCPLRMSRLCR